MERLTTNKSVADMSMIELAHNSCYADDERNARYRDYNLDVDSRWLVRNLAKDICGEDFKDLSDEEVDEYMASMLSVGIGLLALFYRNLWAMADLREKLKYYEDADEQGLLLLLLCKIEDMVYCIEDKQVWCCTIEKISISKNNGTWIEISFPEEMPNLASMEFYPDEIGKTVFLTREEAKAKLKEMEEKDGR